MKILTIISLLASLYSSNSKPIIMNFTKTSTNNTGDTSLNGLLSASFWYTCEDWGYETEISAPQLLGITSVYPQTFILNINLQFKQPVEYAQVSIELPNPRTTNGHADYNFIGDYCKLQSNFTNTIYCEVYNTSLVAIKIIYSAEQLDEYYGITRNLITSTDPDENYWVTNGDLHCNVQGLNLTSCTLSEGIDYSSQLGSLLAYTDGIESFLQTIVNNTSYLSNIATNTNYLSTISTNINTMKTTLSNLYTIAQRDNYLNQLLGGLIQSQNHSVDTIYNVLNNYHDTILPTQFTGGTGPQDPAQYVYIYDLDNDINTQLNRDKLKIVIQFKSYGFENDYYYVDVPIYNSNTQQTFNENLILYSKYSNIIANVGCSFKVTNNYVSLWISLSNTSISTGSTTSVPLSNLSTYILNIFVTDQSITSNQKLDDIISLIDSLAVNVDVDMTNKNTVDSFFEELKQSLTLPSIPQSFNDTIFEKMGILLKPYISMVINFPLYKNILMIASLFTVLGVILL